MENSENSYKVDRYIKGELSSSERNAFEEELRYNASLQKEVQQTQLLHALLAEKRLLDLKNFARENYEADQQSGTGYKYALGTLLACGLAGAVWAVWPNPNIPISAKPKQQMSTVAIPQPVVETVKDKVPAVTKQPKRTKVQVAEDKVTTEEATETIVASKTTEIIENKAIKPSLENTNLKQEPGKKLPESQPCKHIVLHANIQTYPTCLYQEKGAVSVSDMGGGTAPYSFMVKNQAGEVLIPTQLPAGTYIVDLQDGNQCHTQYQHIEIKTKVCPQNYTFNPYANEVWEIPQYKHSGVLTVVDKAGNTYLSKEIPANTQETWDGNSNTGELRIGYYLYSIIYTDGTEIRGAVTLLK